MSTSSSEAVNIPPSTGGKLTPKSSFSYSHSPQESTNGGSTGSGSGTAITTTSTATTGGSGSGVTSNAPRMSLNTTTTSGGGSGGIPSSATCSSLCTNAGGNPIVMTPTSCSSMGGGTAAAFGSGPGTGSANGGTSSSSKLSELKRKPSLHVVLPKFGNQAHGGSSDSLNRSPHSPGSIVGEEPQTEDKELSYKAQRKNYRREKQRVAQELTFALKDPSIIILTGALKVRGKLKGWTKLLAVLKPGLLLFYKGKVKSSHWVATVLLHCCKVIERPSKKEGFCFKVFHPLEQSIWATKGPNGETIGAVVQPLPATYLICRAASTDEGKCWMDGLELALTRSRSPMNSSASRRRFSRSRSRSRSRSPRPRRSRSDSRDRR